MNQFCRHLIESVVEPKRLLGLTTIPSFISGFLKLRRLGETVRIRDIWPQLSDMVSNTPFDPHYLYQGAWLSRMLADAKPAKHCDIGSDSRLITAISAFVPIEFSDIRPLVIKLSGLETRTANACSLNWESSSCSSLSCLHVIEHIGLGRYGDPIDRNGPNKACSEFVRVLAQNGSLYLTTPIGQPRIQFNAHRVFDPRQVLELLKPLTLQSFSYVDDSGDFHTNSEVQDSVSLVYGCGMFHFSKI